MLSVCIRLALREISPIAWTANGLWPYWVFGRMSLPFLPSHAFCDSEPTPPSFSLTQTLTQWCLGYETASVSLETVASVHEDVHHSELVITCPSVYRVLKLSFLRSESRCLPPSFSTLFLSPLLHYPLPEPNISKHPARSHPSGLLVIERVFRQDHGERVSHHLLFLFSFVPHKLRIFVNSDNCRGHL